MTGYLHRKIDLNDPRVVTAFDEASLWSSRFGALLFDHIPLERDLEILDLGCGLGFPTFELAHVFGPSCRVTGVDIWRAALRRAIEKTGVHARPDVQFVEADGADLPFRSATFDLIVSNVGINNFADPDRVLGECARVLEEGSRLVLTTNVVGHMRGFYDVFRAVLEELDLDEAVEKLEAQEAHRLDRGILEVLLGGAGFEVVRVVEDELTLRYLDGTALFHHSLTRVGFLDGWRGVLVPSGEEESGEEPSSEARSREEDVFGRVEERLNAIAREAGELRMTVPMLYVEALRGSLDRATLTE